MQKDTYNTLIPDKAQRTQFMLLIVAAFSVESIFRYILIILNKLPLLSDLSFLFTPGIFLILIYLNYRNIIRHTLTTNDLMVVIAYLAIVCGSYTLFPDNRNYMEAQWELILVTVPMYYFLGVIFTSDRSTMSVLGLLAKGIILIDIAFTVYWQGAGNEMGADAMARAYRLLPSVLFLIMCAFNRSKVTDWIWMVFGAIYLFTCGTRGPIIIVASYILYFMLFKDNKLTVKKLISIGVFVAFIIFYNSPAFESVVYWFGDLFRSLGLSTRVLDHMLEDTLVSDSSGRDVIYERVYEMIFEKPFGYGVMGEWKHLGWNTHNLYLQIIVHFGIVGGAMAIGATIWLLIMAIRKNPNSYARDFLVMWACMTLIHGFVGGSYLSYYFPFLIGLCVHAIRNKKKVKRIGEE